MFSQVNIEAVALHTIDRQLMDLVRGPWEGLESKVAGRNSSISVCLDGKDPRIVEYSSKLTLAYRILPRQCVPALCAFSHP